MRNTRTGLSKRRVSAGALAALLIAAPVLGVTLAATTAHAQIGIDIRIGYAPPPLPYYEQPPLPGPDYLWVPGTWAWSDDIDDYYWVPGYWDLPPEPGLLWTPAWWGWDNYGYRYHQGYWGEEVGWYGGIDYGHGYHGHGWDGGHWDHGHVAYNRAVINVSNVNVTNVYYAPVTVNRGPRVSYNGGTGGVSAQPRPEELRATNAQHFAPTPTQQQHTRQAATNPGAAASRITPAWNPPAVHRIGNDGAPIARPADRGGAGAPGQYQQQRQNPNTPAGTAPRAYQPAPGYGQGQTYNGQAPRPAPQQSAPNYNRAPPQQPAPNYNRAPTQQYAPPQPNAQQHVQPAPNFGHAAPPQPQFHAVTPPAPRPAAPPPPPRPAPPKPQPPHNDHEHP